MPQERTPHSLSRAVVSTGGMTLASRVFGLARDVLIGRIFGDTLVGSAFAAAFAIPNMFRRLFGEGALSAAFIPEYTRAHVHDPARAQRLARLVLRGLGVVTGALTVLIELVLIGLLVFTAPDREQALSIRLIMVMLPFMPLICVTAILAGMLQVHGRYALAASGPIVLNTFIIVTGGYYVLRGSHAGETVAYAMGAATVLSGLTQALTFAHAIRRDRVPDTPGAPDDARDGARVMIRRFIPVMIGLGTLQLNAFLDTLIAMWPIWIGPTLLGLDYPLDERSNVILSLSTRLYQFPLGVFGIAVATAAFPLLARTAHDPDAFVTTLRRGLRLSLLVGLPASAGLLLVRTDLVSVMFSGGGGGFSAQGVERSAAVVAGYAGAVWAYGLNHVLTRAFYAQGDTTTPMRLSIAMVGVNLVLNASLIWVLREAGLAWATASAAMIQCAALWVLASRGFAGIGGQAGLLDAQTLRAGIRLALCTLVMGACVLGAGWGADRLGVLAPGWWGHALRLAICSVAGVLSFTGACWAARCEELRWLLARRV